jgi:hypothetical protein
MRNIFVAMLLTLAAMPALAQAQAVVSIDPSTQTVVIPNDAEVTIQISGVNNLYGFQFDIVFDDSIMDYHTLVEGGFLSQGNPSNVFCVSPDTSVSGQVRNYACTRTVPGEVSGGGDLAVLNFTTQVFGSSPVTLTNIKLSDESSGSISSSSSNGNVDANLCANGATRDCGPSNETGECEYGTSTCSGGTWGECVGATYATDETCDGLDNDCNGESDETWPELGNSCSEGLGICLATGNMICTFDETGTECDAVPGTPQTEACPWTVTDENCDGVTNEHAGDADCSGCVDVIDLSFIGSHFGQTSASPGWDPDADFNNDNVIDIFDLVMVGANFGIGC